MEALVKILGCALWSEMLWDSSGESVCLVKAHSDWRLEKSSMQGRLEAGGHDRLGPVWQQ